MKFAVSIVFALILTGCTSTPSVQFSPSQDYAVSVQSNLFDAVRIADNDITLFNDGKALGFIRLEPISADVQSTSEFIDSLKSASASESTEIQVLGLKSGFKGFSAKIREYQTGYIINEENPDSLLIFSFPEGIFEKVANTISPGI